MGKDPARSRPTSLNRRYTRLGSENTLVASKKPVVYYYGETPHGHRIHIGNWIERVQGTGRRQNRVVATFCGSFMLEWEEGIRPPTSRASDFCKNCFRSIAWEIMVSQMGSLASEIDAASQMRQILGKAESNDWDLSQVTAAFTQLADALETEANKTIVPNVKEKVHLKKKEEPQPIRLVQSFSQAG